MIISEDYYKKEVSVKLTVKEIEFIIDQLENTNHNLFVFLNYDRIIAKLKKKLEMMK